MDSTIRYQLIRPVLDQIEKDYESLRRYAAFHRHVKARSILRQAERSLPLVKNLREKIVSGGPKKPNVENIYRIYRKLKMDLRASKRRLQRLALTESRIQKMNSEQILSAESAA
ncbi:MAG: hypothetical protein A2Z83_00595 [Omnitrophica bacterium GWA2_52_8]|nr:MAG: hypothetical protein A2Z83_00595 [Omnitrophica bacterium GWA2_52_8]